MSSLAAPAPRSGILIDTRKCVRRPVRYESPSDVVADAERLVAADAATMGNWSLAEIIDHVATGIDLMIDGFGYVAPWYVRLVGRAVFKRRILEREMPPRLPFPGGGEAKPFRAGLDVADALVHLREATERMEATQQFAPHPVFGRMPREEVLRLHLRHAELHMGFVREPLRVAAKIDGRGWLARLEVSSHREVRMSSDMQRLGIDKWSVEDRLRLIGEIWDSLEPPLKLSDAHREELDRRLEAADADPNRGMPWEEVRAGLIARD